MKTMAYLNAMERAGINIDRGKYEHIYQRDLRQYRKFRKRLLQKIEELEQCQRDYNDLVKRLPNELEELAVIDCFAGEPKP